MLTLLSKHLGLLSLGHHAFSSQGFHWVKRRLVSENCVQTHRVIINKYHTGEHTSLLHHAEPWEHDSAVIGKGARQGYSHASRRWKESERTNLQAKECRSTIQRMHYSYLPISSPRWLSITILTRKLPWRLCTAGYPWRSRKGEIVLILFSCNC